MVSNTNITKTVSLLKFSRWWVIRSWSICTEKYLQQRWSVILSEGVIGLEWNIWSRRMSDAVEWLKKDDIEHWKYIIKNAIKTHTIKKDVRRCRVIEEWWRGMTCSIKNIFLHGMQMGKDVSLVLLMALHAKRSGLSLLMLPDFSRGTERCQPRPFDDATREEIRTVATDVARLFQKDRKMLVSSAWRCWTRRER